MGLLSNKISKDSLKPGDHIYSWRKAFSYSHHGIYVGNGRVIHFTCGGSQKTRGKKIISSSSPNHVVSPCPTCGYSSQLGGVLSSCLNCFLAGGSLYRFEYSASSITFLAKPRGGACTTIPSDLPEEVVYRANFLLENGFGVYNLFTNNCESFALYCKTSLVFKDQAATSSQVRSVAYGFFSFVSGIQGAGAAKIAFLIIADVTAATAGAALAATVVGSTVVLFYATLININRLTCDKRTKHRRKVPVEDRLDSQINGDESSSD